MINGIVIAGIEYNEYLVFNVPSLKNLNHEATLQILPDPGWLYVHVL